MLFAFVLFAILGWCVFAKPEGSKQILMIVYVVLMLLWLLAGYTGFDLPRVLR